LHNETSIWRYQFGREGNFPYKPRKAEKRKRGGENEVGIAPEYAENMGGKKRGGEYPGTVSVLRKGTLGALAGIGVEKKGRGGGQFSTTIEKRGRIGNKPQVSQGKGGRGKKGPVERFSPSFSKKGGKTGRAFVPPDSRGRREKKEEALLTSLSLLKKKRKGRGRYL